MNNITFTHPGFLFLFLLLIPIIYFWWQNKKNHHIPFTLSTTKGFGEKETGLAKWLPLLFVCKVLAISALIIALARPQSVDVSTKVKVTDGVDIVLAIDVSGSMLSKDLEPNRLEALKDVASEFIQARISDRLGIVVYAAEAYTKTPVTSDKSVVLNSLADVKYDRIIQDGTGIGVGLGTAINRLKDSPAKSKVIILMTDGVNNAGLIDPLLAADMAKEMDVKVYTIGIGTNGMADTPISINERGEIMYKKMKVEIDEELMKTIAHRTNGKYFRATNKKSLEEIYSEINQLEKTKIDETKYVQKTDWFRPFALFAFFILLVEFVLRRTLFKGIV